MELTPALVLILGASGIALASTLLMAAAGNKSAAALLLFIVFLTFDVSFRDRGFGDKSLTHKSWRSSPSGPRPAPTHSSGAEDSGLSSPSR